MPGVFLSYRRSDSGEWTDRLQERLELRFGETLVFRDLDDLRVGGAFLSQLRAAIRRADAVLVVIGPGWLDAAPGETASRLRRRTDVLRREVQWALAKRNAAVIPLLVGGASMPKAADLPESIRALCAQEARSLGDVSWDADCSALLEGLALMLRKARRAEPLEGLHQKLIRREQRYFSLRPTDPGAAREVAEAVLRLLDEQAPFYPHDAFLQICRGYAHKNVAMAILDSGRARGRAKTAKDALDRSDAVFTAIRAEAAVRLAESLNGLGSVAGVRGELRDALGWIDQALALVPDYPAALSDRAQIVDALARSRAPRARRHHPKGQSRARPVA